MHRNFVLLVILSFLFRHATALQLSFTNTSVIQGHDILVNWTLTGDMASKFIIELVDASDNKTLATQTMTVGNNATSGNNTASGQVQFSSENLKPGLCRAKAWNETRSDDRLLALTDPITILPSNDTTSIPNTTTTSSTKPKTTPKQLPVSTPSTTTTTTTARVTVSVTVSSTPTSVTTPYAAAQDPESSGKSSKLSLGIIILAVVLGVVGCIGIGCAIFFIIRWKRRKSLRRSRRIPDPFPQVNSEPSRAARFWKLGGRTKKVVPESLRELTTPSRARVTSTWRSRYRICGSDDGGSISDLPMYREPEPIAGSSLVPVRPNRPGMF